MIKTIVFDIGNVVWKFRPAFDAVFRLWAKELGMTLHQFRLNLYEKNNLYCKFEINSLDLSTWVNQISLDTGPTVFFKILDQKFGDQKFFYRYLNSDTITLISQLRQKGYLVGCLSNTENYFYPYFKHNFFPLFDYHILSWQVGYRKPDPKIYKEIFKYGKFLPSEIIFIDDVPVNVAAANKLGINGVLFTDVSSLRTTLSDYQIL